MTQTNANAPTLRRRSGHGPLPLRAINWILECERRHREKQHLSGLSDEHLDDMGMTRKDVEDENFYRRTFREADKEPMPIISRFRSLS